VAKAKVVHICAAEVDCVRNRPAGLILEVDLVTVNQVLGVVESLVGVVGIGISEEDCPELAEVLVSTIGLLILVQRKSEVVDVVDHALRLVGEGRRLPEPILDGD